MSTQEERKELKSEPLPVSDEDRVIPTKLARLDAAIKAENECISEHTRRISEMQVERDGLIKRAEECGITQDTAYKIVQIPVYKNNKVDVPCLKRLDIDAYLKILADIRTRALQEANEKIEKANTFIPQDAVKREIKDKAMLAQIIPCNTEIDRMNISIVPR